MCLVDNQQHSKAITYLMRAMQTKPMDDMLACAATELVLAFEEVQDMVQARAAAQWAIDQGISQWNDAYQRPGLCCSMLDNHMSFCHSSHSLYPSWCILLQQHYPTIKAEYLQLEASNWSRVGGTHRASGQHDAKVVECGDWDEIVLFGSGHEHSGNVWTQRTRSILKQCVPDAVTLCEEGAGEIIFSRLRPKTRIASHCASTNLRWTAHLGVVVPSGGKCAIRVKDTWHSWKEGEILVFDDSFEHQVVNDTLGDRVVLLLRFWHPSIPPHLREMALAEIMQQQELMEKLRFTPPNNRDNSIWDKA